MERLTLTEPGIKRKLKHKRNQLKKYFKNCPSALAYIELLENAYGDCALGWYYKQGGYIAPWSSTLALQGNTTYTNGGISNQWYYNSIFAGTVTAGTAYAFNLRLTTIPQDKKFTVYIYEGVGTTTNPSVFSVPIPWTSASYTGNHFFIHFTLDGAIASGSVWYVIGPGASTPINTGISVFGSVAIADGMTVSMRRPIPWNGIDLCVNGQNGTTANVNGLPSSVMSSTQTNLTIFVGTRGSQSFQASLI